MTAFGRWLVGQKDRKDSWIGGLASQAAKDRGFPIEGDVETVRLHLGAQGAEPELFEILDDAEIAWLRAA